MALTGNRNSAPRKKATGLLIALLLASSVLLVGAAAVIYVSQQTEGIEAERRAEELLSAAQAGTAEDDAAPALNEAQGAGRRRVLHDLTDYPVMAKLAIEKLGIELPVITECTDEALKVSVCRYMGPLQPGEGHIVITGHNYRSGAHFGNLDTLNTGDRVALMDVWGEVFHYEVTGKQKIRPDDMAALDTQEGDRGLSLLTCTSNANARLLVRCAPVG